MIWVQNKNKGIVTTRDEETGLVRAKGLPYTFNPKLSITTTRKEFIETGVISVKTNKVLKSFLKAKSKISQSLSRASTNK